MVLFSFNSPAPGLPNRRRRQFRPDPPPDARQTPIARPRLLHSPPRPPLAQQPPHSLLQEVTRPHRARSGVRNRRARGIRVRAVVRVAGGRGGREFTAALG